MECLRGRYKRKSDDSHDFQNGRGNIRQFDFKGQKEIEFPVNFQGFKNKKTIRRPTTRHSHTFVKRIVAHNGFVEIGRNKHSNDSCEDLIQNSSKIEKLTRSNNIFELFSNGKKEITINKDLLEDLVKIKLAEHLVDTGQTGSFKATVQKLEKEIDKLRTVVFNLKQQCEHSRIIIRKLIEEKVNGKAWTNRALPPKFTRSVGLQVSSTRPIFEEPPSKTENTLPESKKKTNFSQLIPSDKVLKPEINMKANFNKFIELMDCVLKNKMDNSYQEYYARQSRARTKLESPGGTEQMEVNCSELAASFTPGAVAKQKDSLDDSKVDLLCTSDRKRVVCCYNKNEEQLFGVKREGEDLFWIDREANFKLPFPALPNSSIKMSPSPSIILKLSESYVTGANEIMIFVSLTDKEWKSSTIKFEIYAYIAEEESWLNIGTVPALELPMTCSVRQVKTGCKYYFTTRAVDSSLRVSEFCEPKSICLSKLKC